MKYANNKERVKEKDKDKDSIAGYTILASLVFVSLLSSILYIIYSPTTMPEEIVYAREEWYTTAPAPEEVWVGKLVAQQEETSIVMRTSYYKLMIEEGTRRKPDDAAERTIYSQGQKHPGLDRHVGQRVRLSGKPFDLELEGTRVSEIWPGRILAL